MADDHKETLQNVDESLLSGLEWRCIGPPRGGRVVAVAGDPDELGTFYFGACAGGVWKTEDAGTYWENVSDGFFDTASVGAIAVSESDPNVIYAGTGEACIRGDVTHGDGVYRSTDRGRTWQNLGLADTRHISRVRIHPENPDIAYVAALGHAFGPNTERGVFRTTDGGTTWDRILYKSENAGAADLSLDPSNPRILYAAIWQARRNFWSMTSGGPDSGLWRSNDGGDTWTDITENSGLPGGLKGRIGVAASAAKPGRLWATIEAEDCGIYRSDDYGDTWELVSDERDLQGRPWYYQHIFADTQDADTLWILNYSAWKSIDGGKTFSQVGTPHGDNHDLWIDPVNPRRMIEGNDGGACVSFNGGDSWSTIYNQMTSQFYHVATDDRYPYRVLGTQQDNSAISVPSQTNKGAIPWGDCYTVGSSESGYIVVDPRDPDVVISGAIGSSPGGGGNMLRYDHKTGQVRIITVWPEAYTGWGAKDWKYRFQWTYPIQFSPHDPAVLHATGNVVFRSTDQGSNWDPISPDLTRNDVTKMEPSGGPITKDTSAAEMYGTIFSFVESPHEAGVYWAGSDDGLVHLSRDGGANWNLITPTQLPEWSMINMIELSPYDLATAYLSATLYKLDDNRPLLYKTNDYGESWSEITSGIPDDDFTRCIRVDPERDGLLYCGTETSAYVSFDDGGSWQPLRANMPVVPVYDLQIKGTDLIAATHGRSFWILDDLEQLRQMTPETTSRTFKLFAPRSAVRAAAPFGGRKPAPGKSYQLALGSNVTFTESETPEGARKLKFLDAGSNPPSGPVFAYFLADEPDEGEEVVLKVLDNVGETIRTFSSTTQENNGPRVRRVPANAGVNRFIWDTRYAPARHVPGDKTTEDRLRGPLAPPGNYRVSLTVGGETQSESFEIVKDPRVEATEDDFKAQFDLLIEIRDRLSEVHDSINTIRGLKRQADEWARRTRDHSAADTVASAASSLKDKLSAIEAELIQTEYRGARDRLNLPTRLNVKLAEITNVVAAADFAPPQQAHDVLVDVGSRIRPHIERLKEVVNTDAAEFENLVHELELPAIVADPNP
jgi:photosystem II stability/assembly factor-like uncharacterized protein